MDGWYFGELDASDFGVLDGSYFGELDAAPVLEI